MTCPVYEISDSKVGRQERLPYQTPYQMSVVDKC